MELAFKNACLLLQDHTDALRSHIYIPDLLVIVKEYYCSTLLFENALFRISAHLSGDELEVLARLLEAEPGVACWTRDALRLHRGGSIITIDPIVSLAWILQPDGARCYRPGCYHKGANAAGDSSITK